MNKTRRRLICPICANTTATIKDSGIILKHTWPNSLNPCKASGLTVSVAENLLALEQAEREGRKHVA